MILLSNLSPWPLSLAKEEGSAGKRGTSPLSKISSPSPFKERYTMESQREASPLFSHQPIFWSGVFKRGIAPLLKSLPLPLIKGLFLSLNSLHSSFVTGGV